MFLADNLFDAAIMENVIVITSALFLAIKDLVIILLAPRNES